METGGDFQAPMLRTRGYLFVAFLLSPPKEGSKKGAANAHCSMELQSRKICLQGGICCVVVARQSQRLASLLRLASAAPKRFCSALQLLRNLCISFSPVLFLCGGRATRGLHAPKTPEEEVEADFS